MDALQKKVIDAVDEEFIVRTTTDLVQIPSPTGHEGDAARFMAERYREAGLETHLQFIYGDRYNAVGVLRGKGSGYSLMFNGHLDTSYTGEERELTAPGYKNKCIRDGDWLIGNGTNNMKSADVAYLAAVRALMEAGVTPVGDIVIAAVAGEIEKNPVDEYQGPDYHGYGVGTRHLITHGFLTDFCILGEPSALQIAQFQGGTMWFKVTTRGLMGHIGYGYIKSAVECMERVQAAIRRWIPEYESRNEFMGERPHVNLASVEGGWPYRAGRIPVECNLYVDVRLVPGQRIPDVRREFMALIRKINEENPDIGAVASEFCSIPPSGIPSDALTVRVIKKAHQEVMGEPPNVIFKPHYEDSAHLHRYGVETVIYGCAGRVKTKSYGWAPEIGEHVFIPDVVNAAKVYALAALDISSSEADSRQIQPDAFAQSIARQKAELGKGPTH